MRQAVPALRRSPPPTEGSLWRYLPLLPVGDPGLAGTPLRAAGWTPAAEARPGWLRSWAWPGCGSRTRPQPNGFLQGPGQRGGGRPRAREIGADVVVTASTGNAGAALAGMAAAVGQPAVIFAPRRRPPAKIAQLLIFGAQVYPGGGQLRPGL